MDYILVWWVGSECSANTEHFATDKQREKRATELEQQFSETEDTWCILREEK